MNRHRDYLEAQSVIEKKYQTSQRQLFKTLGFNLEKPNYHIQTYKKRLGYNQ